MPVEIKYNPFKLTTKVTLREVYGGEPTRYTKPFINFDSAYMQTGLGVDLTVELQDYFYDTDTKKFIESFEYRAKSMTGTTFNLTLEDAKI